MNILKYQNFTKNQIIENNSLIYGKCEDIMPYIPNNSVDLILADLPYQVTQNKNDILIPFDILWTEYNRIAKTNANIILFSQGLFYVDLINSNRKNFRYDIVWNKILTTGFLNAKKQPLRLHEQICVFKNKRYSSKDKWTYNPIMKEGNPQHSKGNSYVNKEVINNNYGKHEQSDNTRSGNTLKYPTSIWTFQKPHPSKARHRTEKPVELLEELIKTYSNEGDVVMDNCFGSATTILGCQNTNRNYIGIESDEYHFLDSCNRVQTNDEFLKQQ